MKMKVNYLSIATLCKDYFNRYRSIDFIEINNGENSVLYELSPAAYLNFYFSLEFPRFSLFCFRVFICKKTGLIIYKVYYCVKTTKKVCFHEISLTSNGNFQHTWHF